MKNEIMATLSKHGELGQIERLLDKVAYCADGKILRNTGSGWKQWRKLKPSFDMAVEWPKKQAAYLQRLRDDPYYADYRELLHKLVSFQNRPIVHETIANLGNDVDGCWSELQDYDSMHGSEIGLSVQELQDLADAYQGMMDEMKRHRAERAAAEKPAEVPVLQEASDV